MQKKRATKLNKYREGGTQGPADGEEPMPDTPPDRSWLPGRKGQGGEGLSDGYGGSRGYGTGASGPQTPAKDRRKADLDAIARDRRSRRSE